MKKIKPIKIDPIEPRDPNWRDMLTVKNQPFVDRKKKKDKDRCREKVNNNE